METKSIAKTKKSNIGQYIILFVIISVFAYIVQKSVSLPQSIMRPVGVMALTLLFASAFSKPIIPFLVLVAYMPFSRVLVGDFDTGKAGLNLTNVLIFIAIIGWINLAVAKRDGFFKRSSLTLAIGLFICWGIASLVKSSITYGTQYFESFIVPLKRWLTPIIMYFIAINMVRDRTVLKMAITTIMVVTLVIGAMASWAYLDVKDSGRLESARVGGVFEQPNTLGGFFVYNMFLFLGFAFIYFPAISSFLLLIPFLVSFRGVMVTFSRGAYLGVAAGGMATTFFRSKALFAVIIVMLILGVLNPSMLPAGVRYRMSSTYGDSDTLISADVGDIKDKSASRRIDIWKGAVEIIKDYPIFGVGYGLFPHFIPAYAPVKEVDAHNTYLILAAEMGIPSLLIFLLILFIMTKNSLWLYLKTKDRFVKAFSLGMLGNLAGLGVVNMFGSRLNSEEVGAYFWIYAGLIMATVAMKKRGEIV